MHFDRVALFSRQTPRGVQIADDLLDHPGDIYFVDSEHANTLDAAHMGRNPQVPFATVDYAVGMCTADNSDVIFVMPGHNEAIADAAGIVCDVAGVRIIGLGWGALIPYFTFDAEASDIDITADDVTLENLHFYANFADVSAMIDVDAHDCTIRNCWFEEVGTNLNGEICILDAALLASHRRTVEGCYAVMVDAEDDNFVSFVGTGDGHIIRDNIVIGNFDVAAIGGTTAVTYGTVTDNYIYNACATNDTCILLSGATKGVCFNNITGGGAAVANGVTATDVALAENYYQITTSDLNGVLDPVAT